MDNYFTMTQIRNKEQRLAYIRLSIEGKALERWKVYRNRYTTWEVVQDSIREYHTDYCNPERTLGKFCDLKQTGTFQKFLNNIDWLDVNIKMNDIHWINIRRYTTKTSRLNYLSGRRNSSTWTSSTVSSKRRNKITKVIVRDWSMGGKIEYSWEKERQEVRGRRVSVFLRKSGTNKR